MISTFLSMVIFLEARPVVLGKISDVHRDHGDSGGGFQRQNRGYEPAKDRTTQFQTK